MAIRLQKLLKKIKKFRRNNKSNLNMFLIFASIVMIWNGISNLLNLYFLNHYPLITNLICIALGVVILLTDDGKLGELEGEAEELENKLEKEFEHKIEKQEKIKK